MTSKRPLFRARRPTLVLALGIGFTAILGLVIFSPFALAELAHSRLNWSQLSNIGQTYGAVSALLSSLALAGVIISLLYQARASRTMNEQVTRTLHHELLRMEMGDPSLMTAVGAPWGLPIPAEASRIRQYLYIQMWVSFLAGNYLIGETDELAVRYIAANELFRSQAGRDYWKSVGQTQAEGSKGRRKQFFQILGEEYEKTLSNDVPISDPVKASEPRLPSGAGSVVHGNQAQRWGSIAVAATVGLLAGRLWRDKKVQQ
jgi:Family of unknown function (DUF6082)